MCGWGYGSGIAECKPVVDMYVALVSQFPPVEEIAAEAAAFAADDVSWLQGVSF